MRKIWLVCSVIALTGAVAGNVTATKSSPPAAAPGSPPAIPAAAAPAPSLVSTTERPTAAVWRWQPDAPDRRPRQRWSNRYDRYGAPTWSHRSWRNWRPRSPSSGASGFAWRRPFYDRRYGGYAYPSPPRRAYRYGPAAPGFDLRPDRYAPDRYAYAGRGDPYGRRWVWAEPRNRD